MKCRCRFGANCRRVKRSGRRTAEFISGDGSGTGTTKLKVTYTTDTRPTDSIVRNARGSDLFICEGMYGEKGDVNNAVKYKHMTFEEAGRLAKQAGVKELWLTHYSPALNRPEQYIEDVRQIFQNAYPGKDKKSLELNFEES